MSFEPHYANSWIIYCLILYIIGFFGFLIKDLINPYNNIGPKKKINKNIPLL